MYRIFLFVYFPFKLFNLQIVHCLTVIPDPLTADDVSIGYHHTIDYHGK